MRPSPQSNQSILTSPLLTSLPLQLSLYFDSYYVLLYTIIELLLFIYKPVALPYPSHLIGWETSAFTFLTLIHICRFFIGYKANLIQSKLSLILFLILCLPCLVGHIYLYNYQTYVLRIDQVINVIEIIFIVFEIIIGIITFISFTHKPII